MHVTIDALAACHPEASGRGLGRYVDALLTDVPRANVDVTALVTEDRTLPSGVHGVKLHRVDPHVRLEWYEHVVRIGFDAARTRPDVFHSPGLEPPLWYRRPWVQTLHDVTPLVFPSDEWGVEPFRWRLRGTLMRRAAAVICISQHTADVGVRHLGLRPERLHVIHHGVAAVFRDECLPFVAEQPYILMVSGFGPHKGFAEAFDIVGRLADAGLPHELRVVGDFQGAHAVRVAQLRMASRRPDRIRLEGRLDDRDVAGRYRGADAVIVTSRYEGFGLPALEAMTSGAAVVAFDNSSLGEIVGDGGVLVADGDVVGFTRELAALLSDDAAREDVRASGRRRAQQFSRERSAQQHAEIYASVA